MKHCWRASLRCRSRRGEADIRRDLLAPILCHDESVEIEVVEVVDEYSTFMVLVKS